MTAQAQKDVQAQTWDEFTINPGIYQFPGNLLLALKSGMGEIGEMLGGATAVGVVYYEEHSRWAWIDLMGSNGEYFDVKNGSTWNVVFTENNQEYLALLESISRDGLNAGEMELLDDLEMFQHPIPIILISRSCMRTS